MDVPHPDGIPPEDLLARADALRDGGAWADAAEIYAAYLRRSTAASDTRRALTAGSIRGGSSTTSAASPAGRMRRSSMSYRGSFAARESSSLVAAAS